MTNYNFVYEDEKLYFIKPDETRIEISETADISHIIELIEDQIEDLNDDYTELMSQISAILKSEKDSISDSNYSVGDVFYYSPLDIMFLVIAPITVGDTIASGANVTVLQSTLSTYLITLVKTLVANVENKIKAFHDVKLLNYKNPVIYEKSKANNGTKTGYTTNSCSFATGTSGDFNGIIYGYNTSAFTPLTGTGIADTVVFMFYAEITTTDWKLSAYKSGQGTHRYDVVNGFNAIEIPVAYIESVYFYRPENATATSITISDLIVYQGTDYENPYAYVTEPVKGFKKMLNVGDSLSNITGNGGTGVNRWQYVLLKKCGIENFTTAGGVGYTVALYSGQSSIWEAVDALTTDNEVDIVTFWGGTNDWSMNIPIGDFDANVATQDNTTFFGAVISCVKKLLTLYPTKRIFLIGTTPRQKSDVVGDFSTRGAVNSNNNTLMDFNDAVKTVAEYYSIPYIDLMKVSGITDLNFTQFLYQQTYNTGFNYYLHFTETGELRIGDTLAGFVNSITGCTV